MAVTTVAQFAAQLGRPTPALIEQLQSAGVTMKTPDDAQAKTLIMKAREHWFTA